MSQIVSLCMSYRYISGQSLDLKNLEGENDLDTTKEGGDDQALTTGSLLWGPPA